MPEGSLEIHLLGPFRVSVDGAPVDESRWARKKAKTLVKLLALEPSHQMSRDRLQELLWPDVEPEPALNNFHKTLHAARRALEPDLKSGAESRFLQTLDQRLLLGAPATLHIDVEEFERRARLALDENENFEYALSAYSGELLPEDRLEDWTAIPRERIASLYQDLLLRLADARESAGNPRGAIDLLAQAVAAQPTNESAHRHLMRLYAALGNRTMALNQFRACAAALKKELDAEPESATLKLYAEIQEGQRGLDPALVELVKPSPIAAPVSRRTLAVSVAAVLLVLAGCIGWWWTLQRAGQRIASLAVAPFTLQGGAALEHISDGLTESVINSLSQLPDLRVMARSTVFAYKEKSVNPRELAKAVGAHAVLVGHVSQQRSPGLDVRVELVDARDGARLWGRQYTFAPQDTPAMHSRIATDVAGALAYNLQPGDERKLARRGTTNPQAHELYQLGRYQWNQRTTAGFRKAIQHFEQAAAADPSFALAYAGLADCYGLLAFGDAPPRDYFPQARAMAEKALSLDPELAEGHTSLAMVKALYDWDWPQAEAEFRRALALNPGHATAHHWYAVHLNAQGRVAEARDEFARALALDPLSRIIRTNAVYPDHYQRNFDAAILGYRKVLELDPAFAVAHEDLMLALEEAGRLDQADEEASLFLRLEGHADLANRFDAAVRTGGHRAGLLEWQRHWQRRAQTSYVSPMIFADFAVRLGDREEAFRWLDRALAERASPLVYLKVNPLYDPLRGDPRFAALLRKIGLP